MLKVWNHSNQHSNSVINGHSKLIMRRSGQEQRKYITKYTKYDTTTSSKLKQTLVLSTGKDVILSTVLSLKMLYVVRTDQ